MAALLTSDPTTGEHVKVDENARRAYWKIKVKGVDITSLVKKDLISLEIKDNEEDEADDFQLKLADRDGVWLQKWLNETVQKGAKTKGLQFNVWIGIKDSNGQVKKQKSGNFLLDSMKHSGPPSVTTIKCLSLDFAGGIRTEARDKSWENYSIKGIAKDIAKKGKLKVLFLAKKNPKKERWEQSEETDIAFLVRICRSHGLAVKITDRKLVIFQRGQYDSQDAIASFVYGKGKYTKWDCGTTSGDVTYDICTVEYTNPKTGKVIKGVYKSPEWQAEEDRVAEANADKEEGAELETAEHTELKIRGQKVTSIAKANELAEVSLNLKNTFERTVTLTLPGNPAMLSGLPVTLKKFGYWSGKYMISEVMHSIGSSGYTTKIKLRFIK